MRHAVMAGAFVAALLVVAVAFAHAEPVTVEPGDGAVLPSPPARVLITMSQEMARTQGAKDIDVLDAAGQEVTTEAARIEDSDRRPARPNSAALRRMTPRRPALFAESSVTSLRVSAASPDRRRHRDAARSLRVAATMPSPRPPRISARSKPWSTSLAT
ncbi:MAG: hypothetical protein ACR2HN_07965 [Tepidiformaceae bacterium]